VSFAVWLTHLPSRIAPLPSEPNTNWVPEHGVPQLLCHQRVPFRPAQSAGSLRIDHSQWERQPPSRNGLHPGLGIWPAYRCSDSRTSSFGTSKSTTVWPAAGL